MSYLELFERCLKIVPGGVHSPVRAYNSVGGIPVFFKSAYGAHLYSEEGGAEYIDFCQSFGPLLLGHRDQEVQEEVVRMIDTLWTSGTLERYSLELAEWIVENVPHVEKLRFVNSGTEAVMSALRVARAVTGKEKVLKFEGCYHGHVDSLLVKSGSGLAGESASSSAGVSEQTARQTLVCPLDDIESFKETLEKNKKELAAVILEPLPANFGLLEQRKEFLEEVFNLTQKAGALVIFDEVISGFRVGLEGMAGELGLKPDLVTYGKIIGGGFPVGCYAGKKEYMDLVAPKGPVYQAGTLSANPIGMVAGLTTLKKAKREKVWQELEKRNNYFSGLFNSFSDEEGLETYMHTKSSLFWLVDKKDPVRSVKDIPKNHGEGFKVFFNTLLNNQVYLAPNGFEVGFLGYAHTETVLEKAAQVFKQAAVIKRKTNI